MPETLRLTQTASYPGVPPADEASYCWTQGITPSTATYDCFGVDLTQIPAVGDLTFGDGNQSVALRNCLFLEPRPHIETGGRSVTLTFLDFRWSWRYRIISGMYNQLAERHDTVPLSPFPEEDLSAQPKPEDLLPGQLPLDPRTVRDARTLCRYCLAALGVTSYSLDPVPADFYPPVNWDNTPAAQALQSIAEQCGCRVVANPLDLSVAVVKQGVGASLPPGGTILSQSESVKLYDRPDAIACDSAPVRCQMMFALEPVGLDFDNSIRAVDDLSYKPWIDFDLGDPPVGPPFPGRPVIKSRGWQDTEPFTFPNLPGLKETTAVGGGGSSNAYPFGAVQGSPDRTMEDARKLAVQSVWKWYRIMPVQGDYWVAFGNQNVVDQTTGAVSYANMAPDGGQNLSKMKKSFKHKPLRVPPQGKRKKEKVDPTGWIKQSKPKDPTATIKKDLKLIRLFPFLNDSTLDDLGRPAQCPARVYGVHTPHWRATPFRPGAVRVGQEIPSTLGFGDEVKVPFTIDVDHQLVAFNQPIYWLVNGRYYFPYLMLHCTCEFADNNTLQYVRQRRTRPFKSQPIGGGTAVVTADDVRYFLTARYNLTAIGGGGPYTIEENEAGRPPPGVTIARMTARAVESNDAEFAARADRYIFGELQNYDGSATEDKEWGGIRSDVAVDGAIQQVTWSVGAGRGPRTRASVNSEHSDRHPPYLERRLTEEASLDRRQRVERFQAAMANRAELHFNPTGISGANFSIHGGSFGV